MTTPAPAVNSLFLRACRGEPNPRPPLWMMRQAGRYLPEYRAVRQEVSFLELCKTPDLACEVTMQPIRRFGFDVAILFCDILIPLEAMGMLVQFTEERGPVLPSPVRNAFDVAQLAVPDPEETMPFVMEAVKRIRQGLDPLGVPLIGFCGAPLTLAAYAVEGGGSKSGTFTKLKSLLYSDPLAARALLGKLARTSSAYLSAQIGAGVHAVQLFDTWAGALAPRDYEEFAFPYTKQIVDDIHLAHPGIPVIVYVNGGAAILERVAQTGADVVGLDWRMDIASARARLGSLPVQGNLDPCLLFAPEAVITERVVEIIRRAGPAGHVFNLGHGITPDTPIAGVEALVAAVRGFPAT
jgi:uroporphyrinogen decarboxylase